MDDDPAGSGLYERIDGYHGISAGTVDPETGFILSGFMPEADARLIAAAPDLLAALTRIVDVIQNCRSAGIASATDLEIEHLARAAIAQATGGAS